MYEPAPASSMSRVLVNFRSEELFERPMDSKQHLHLHPHATDPTIREIAVQKTACRRGGNTPFRHLYKLRVIEGVLGLPAKLQPLALRDADRPQVSQVKISCSVCE